MTGIEGTKGNKDTAFILWNLYFSGGRRYIKKMSQTNQDDEGTQEGIQCGAREDTGHGFLRMQPISES